MSFSRVYSAQTYLLKGQIINIETDISKGLNSYNIVGLPDKSVDEAKDRVSGALKNTGFVSPKQKNNKTVVSLVPADQKKEGSYFDLAIAVGFLLSTGELEFNPDNKIFVGELSLDGKLQPLKGILSITMSAKENGYTEIFLPDANKDEASLIEGITIYPALDLEQVISHLQNEQGDTKKNKITPYATSKISDKVNESYFDFSNIKGQESAKRALIIAAAGCHNICMYGPPGTGKTMLARAFANILPKLTKEQMLEVTGIHSVAGLLNNEIITEPPFRSPHHTSSYVSIIGGGTFPKPGEVTLAHKGVLFLDEFPEFDKKVIECLRQPLEDKHVTIARAKGTSLFPSDFLLVSAMNPCPCGYNGSKNKNCVCKPQDIERYKRKVSGPIMDRIDIWIPVSEIDYKRLSNTTEVKNMNQNPEIRLKVQNARSIAIERYKSLGKNITTNSAIGPKEIEKYIILAHDVKKLLDESAEKLSLSARAYHRIIKLARTIADLENSAEITQNHILEALQYRPKLFS